MEVHHYLYRFWNLYFSENDEMDQINLFPFTYRNYLLHIFFPQALLPLSHHHFFQDHTPRRIVKWNIKWSLITISTTQVADTRKLSQKKKHVFTRRFKINWLSIFVFTRNITMGVYQIHQTPFYERKKNIWKRQNVQTY